MESHANNSGPLTRLRLLSYNIQTSLPADGWYSYIAGSWRHLFPCEERLTNLKNIGELLKDFDIIALQEVDSGSFRSQFINQVDFLSTYADFPYWKTQRNRNFGYFAQHSNGWLSRIRPSMVRNHPLPGHIRGRGAMEVVYGQEESLNFIMVHLSLGKHSREKQFAYLAQLAQKEHVIIMGDFNCDIAALENSILLQELPLKIVSTLNTFPSWSPNRSLDYMLLSKHLHVVHVHVFQLPYSDHLPLGVEIEVPAKWLLS